MDCLDGMNAVEKRHTSLPGVAKSKGGEIRSSFLVELTNPT